MADMEAINGSLFPNPRKELRPIKALLAEYDHTTLLRAYALFRVEQKEGLSSTPYAFTFKVKEYVARLAIDEKREGADSDAYAFFPINPDELIALQEMLG
jgi:hypothetical protein